MSGYGCKKVMIFIWYLFDFQYSHIFNMMHMI
jgi:hypothetical protein